MANLKEIRNRIGSISSTMQITSAMKMVSAAKLKRAQDAVTQMRPYANKLQELLGNLSASLDLSENLYAEVRAGGCTLVVAITSNRGLCGGFNNNIIKRVNQIIAENNGQNIELLPIGKKVRDAFKRSNLITAKLPLVAATDEVFNELNFSNTAEIAGALMHAFTDKSINKVVLVYNRFVNAASQEVMHEQLLPIVRAVSQEESVGDYIFEPSKQEIVSELIPKSLKLQLFKALLDSHAAEHGARMTAMHKATDNASDLLKGLKLSYNKARQAAITNEILEIVGGANALDN
jgi:F-type H+-transporting ATPase subunit gamma